MIEKLYAQFHSIEINDHDPENYNDEKGQPDNHEDKKEKRKRSKKGKRRIIIKDASLIKKFKE